MSAAKAKGTAAETAVVGYLRERRFRYAERRSLSGVKDLGDITGTPGLTWEVKSGARLDLPGWLRETETERANSGSDFAFLVVKPHGVGVTRVGEWWAVQPLRQLLDIIPDGYGRMP